MTERQRQFDFSARGSQLRLLNSIDLPKAGGASAAAMLAVLRAIDDQLRDQREARIRTAGLAEKTQLTERQVKRALRGLRSLFLIDSRRTGRANLVCICWGNVAEYDRRQASDGTSGPARDGTRSPIRSDKKSHQMGQEVPSTITPAMQTPPPPPRAKSEEEEAFCEVGKAGVATSREAVRAALARGETPAEIVAAVAEWRDGSASGRWRGPGALAWRLERGVWPAGDVARTAAAVASADASRRRAAHVEAAAVAADDRRHLAELEARHGARLDAMAPDELLGMLPEGLRRLWRPGRFRAELLEAMEERASFSEGRK